MSTKKFVDWTREEVLILIDLYEAESLLYDCSSALYKNRCARSASLEKIADKLKEKKPEITPSDAKNKIATLRGQFSNEVAKMKKTNYKSGMGTEEKEEPYWFHRLQFLEKFLRPRQSESSFIIISEEEVPGSEDSFLDPPDPKRPRKDMNTTEEDRRPELLKMAIEAINKPQELKYSNSVEAFGEFIKSQSATFPEEHQSNLFQQVIELLFKLKN